MHDQFETPGPDAWSVVVVYEDLATRERAMAACDQLVNRFWPDLEFKFLWWRTDFLEDDGMAATAGENATQADFIIYCGSSAKPFSVRMKQWFKWALQRNGRELALLDLSDLQGEGHTPEKMRFLRQISYRAKVEYLTSAATKDLYVTQDLPAGKKLPLPMPSLFDRILHHEPGHAFSRN